MAKASKRQAPVTRRPLPPMETDPTLGLTQSQVQARLQAGWSNDPGEPPTKTEGQIIRENCLTFFNLIFLILAALLVVTGSYKNMMFLVIAIANTAIGTFQEIRSKRTVDKLTLVAERPVNALREGVFVGVRPNLLVRDDIIQLAAGDQICADGVVRTGELQVNESLITGEADAILKGPGDTVKSGSFVVAGRGLVQLTQVGPDAYAAKLSAAAKQDVHATQSEMMRSLDRLIRVVGFALIPVGCILFYQQHFVLGLDLAASVEATVSALIGMIPEGLYLLTSVAMAVSAMKLAQRKVLVQDMNCIETLARVDVLCVDKTGTVTQPDMSVQELVCLAPQTSPQQVEGVLGAYYQVMDADNDTAKALARRFQQGNGWQAQQVVPFTSANKWSAVVFQDHGSYVLGAPEFILKEGYQAIAHRVEPYQQAGCRVLLLAQCDTPPTQEGGLQGAVVPVALVVVANPIRPEAPDTFRYFAKYGVDVKVISGDNPQTVSRVAQQAGIAGAERFVDAATLKEPGDYDRAVQEYNVFGRVTPDQKRKLVKALQKAGHTVAMTGDGVNDVLALKDADCGIAMASGAEAACQVAELVLLDSDFSAMPRVVEEGRRVINNIQRAAALYLVKNIMSVFLALITLIAGFPYPFVPIQLTLISALTIGIPSFVLALEPNHELVRGRFMHNVLRRALPGGLTNIVLIVGLELFTYAFTFQRATLSTLSTVTIGAVGLLVIYYVARPLDKKRWALLGAMTVAMVVAVVWFGPFFELTALDLQSALVVTVFLLLTPSVIYAFETAFEWGSRIKGEWLKRRKQRVKTEQ